MAPFQTAVMTFNSKQVTFILRECEGMVLTDAGWPPSTVSHQPYHARIVCFLKSLVSAVHQSSTSSEIP